MVTSTKNILAYTISIMEHSFESVIWEAFQFLGRFYIRWKILIMNLINRVEKRTDTSSEMGNAGKIRNANK